MEISVKVDNREMIIKDENGDGTWCSLMINFIDILHGLGFSPDEEVDNLRDYCYDKLEELHKM